MGGSNGLAFGSPFQTLIQISRSYFIYYLIYLTVILRGRAGYELIYELVIISSYQASPRRITVLVNFQAILMISWVKPPQIVTFSLPKTPRKNVSRPPKFQHKKFAISVSLFGQT